MAAVSANIIHHQQQSGHSKVAQDEQSEEESNDGSLHSVAREKHGTISSPEYKPSTPDAGVMDSYNEKVTENAKYACSPNQSNTRSPSDCADSPEGKIRQPQFNSSFSMHNVLKMKSERDSVSPPSVAFSSNGKHLENTPNYSKSSSYDNSHRHDESSYDRTPKRITEEEMDYRETEFNRSSSPVDDEEKSNRLDLSGSNVDDGNSCCSDDTVLSVGNEAQVNSCDAENRTCSTANSTALSPQSSPAASPASSTPGNLQGLSSFKHIQSHLSSISQLSQNLHGSQHMLLRPNPITPNPLMFLNQNRLLFNPHLPLQANPAPIDAVHQSSHSLSNSPTSANPALSGLSPNDLSPTASLNSNQLSPSPPGFEGKLNIPGFGAFPSQIGQSLRFYKQNLFPSAGISSVPPNSQGISNNFSICKKMTPDDKSENRKMQMKSLNGSQFFSPSGINERLFSNNNVLANNANITNHNPDVENDRHNIILNHNGLKFSIDNILKADFGRRITDPLHKRSKSSSSKHKFGAAVLNPHGLSAGSGGPNPMKHVPLQHLNIKESFGNSAFNKSAFHHSKDSDSYFNKSKSSSASSNLIPNTNLNLSSSSSSSLRLSSERLSTETKIPPAGDVKSVSSLQNNLVSSSVGGSAVSEKSAEGSGNPIDLSKQELENNTSKGDGPMVWPAWVYCTRYSDRPSSGPRTRRPKKPAGETGPRDEEKRPRTAFSGPQLARLKHEFNENRYLTERRRQHLSAELGLNEAQIKIWFQNKRAKIKKASGQKNPLALQLMAQGLYNHSTVPLTKEEEELQELHARETRETKA